ncbi:MAG: S8 family serine peptidase [bacterium]
MDIPEAWGLSEGNNVVVAVIDSGVAYYHPDLAGNMWDGTLCKSDTGAPLGGCLHGYDFEDDDKNPLPSRSTHGTHIAGTIAAIKNNAIGIAGVAPQVKIMAIKSSLTSSNIVQSINFAKQNGAKIINASWGSADSSLSTDNALIGAIQGFPGIFVAAAGNDGTDNDTKHFYPSDYTLDNVISVTATTEADEKASY